MPNNTDWAYIYAHAENYQRKRHVGTQANTTTTSPLRKILGKLLGKVLGKNLRIFPRIFTRFFPRMFPRNFPRISPRIFQTPEHQSSLSVTEGYGLVLRIWPKKSAGKGLRRVRNLDIVQRLGLAAPRPRGYAAGDLGVVSKVNF